MTIASDIQLLAPGSLIELFVLDLTSVGSSVLYFHTGLNNMLSSVVWQGITYTAMPMQFEGWELSGKGQLPRPKARVSNATGLIGTYCKSFNDLVGARLTRKRTFVKYLDAVNFAGGVNPTADPNVHFADDVYFVDRKAVENKTMVEFELAAAFDVQGIALPRRQFIQNVCAWKYKSPECGYAGTAYFLSDDTPTANPVLDVCGKRLNSCKARFGTHNPLPFGGFPATGLIK